MKIKDHDDLDGLEIAVKIVKAICKKHGVDNSYVPKEFIEDTMPCPLCGTGIMTYTISNYNGHRSGECKCFGQYVE